MITLRLAALVASAIFAAPTALAKDLLVREPAEFNRAIATARPGDVIVLADGTWRDFQMKVSGTGVTVRGEHPGRVILTGRSNLRLSGRDIVVSDLVFRNGYSPTSEVISFRGNGGDFAYDSRVTGVVIDGFSKPNASDTDYWVVLYGRGNRFDHNHLVGKTNRGVTVSVRLHDARGRDNGHRIDHNYFGPRPQLGKNGGETIRVGTSENATARSGTIIERNLFDRTDGELEIVSIKSGGNVVRDNLFLRARGTVTLRHGTGNLVERNVFLGHGKAGTGGIRVIDSNHVVRGNYMEGLRGTGTSSALSLMNGDPRAAASGHATVRNARIERNTVVASAAVTLGAGADARRTAAPQGSTMASNLFANTERFVLASSARGIEARGNVAVGGKVTLDGVSQSGARMVRAANGLLYPADRSLTAIGAPRDLKPVSRGEVGVAWYR